MPTNLTDVSTFTDPVAVPVDGDVRNAASVQTPFQALANRTRKLIDRLGGIAGSSEITYEAAKARTKFISALNAVSMWNHTAGSGGDGAPGWRPVPQGSDPNQAFVMTTFLSAEAVYLAISEHIPRDAVITAIRVRVKPGAARTGANRMKAAYHRRNASSQTYVGPIASGFDDESTNEQFIAFTGLTITNDETNRIQVVLFGGNDAATNLDLFIGVSVDFNQPGPMF